MEDRLVRGFVAGVIGGVAANLWSFLAGYLQWTTLRYADWTAIIIFAHRPPFTAGETVWATLIQIGFSGGLGVIFAYLLLLIESRNILFRGWLYAEAVWFLIYGVTTLFQVDGSFPLPLKTVISNSIAAAIYGLVLAQNLKVFAPAAEEARKFRSPFSVMPLPAAKPLRGPEDGDEEE
ncbi:MAG TPA: hypothetical protein PKA10_06715 [Selenomonadales bacterium]|nr:hypothetical protein [Selenomonadales bacterium]